MSTVARALILDFGGVITRTLFETHALTEKALQLQLGALTWRGPFDPASDPLWRSMQAGEITERDYWLTRTRETGELVGKSWTKMSDFLRAARGDTPGDVIRPEFLQTLHRAKSAGLRLAILSNELDLFYGAGFRKKLPFLEVFDVIHDATYTKVLKPDPAAFAACLADLALPAEHCVFVDDQKRNVDGARKAGLQAVHFDVRNPAESYARAEQLFDLN